MLTAKLGEERCVELLISSCYELFFAMGNRVHLVILSTLTNQKTLIKFLPRIRCGCGC